MLRWERGLSQEQLAEKVWISTTHMSHIETGSTKLSLPVLVDIAGALSVSVDEILSGGETEAARERRAGSHIEQMQPGAVPLPALADKKREKGAGRIQRITKPSYREIPGMRVLVCKNG